MCKSSILVFFFFAKVIFSAAQIQTSVPNIVPPSPTSMQFQKYGDYPVNHFTGIPGISIPLYTITEGELQVPISLSYHASGTRVDDVSGFVGLGWTLNVGGMLTRTIKGFPDDGVLAFEIPSQPAQSINWSDAPYASQLDQIEQWRDHEYDIWSYNFLGRSGKYLLTSNGAFPIEATNLKLDQPGLGILDENGIEYVFGGNGIETTEYSDPTSSVTKSAQTTFPLFSIKSAKDPNNVISYDYQLGPNYVTSMYPNTYMFDDWWSNNLIYTSSNFTYSIGAGSGGIMNGYYLMKNQTYCPKAIYFRNGQVKFIQNTTTKMLSRIEVLDSKGNLIKAIDFNITMFPSAFPQNGPFQNYKLQSFIVKSPNNLSGETYSFNYYNENISPSYAKPEAYALSANKDHWGFYNGINDPGYNRLPTYQSLLTRTDGPTNSPFYRNFGGGSNKEPSEENTKTFVLNKITYPTGGYTSFDYELNRFSNNTPAGGLRIKNITSYWSNNQISNQKNYTYYLGTSEIMPSQDYYLTTNNMDAGPGHTWFRRVTLSEDPYINLSPRGSSVTYSNVTETDNNGSISYIYDSDNAYTYEDLNYPGIYDQSGGLTNWIYKKIANNYKPWNYGNLIEKQIQGSDFVQTEVNEYEEFIQGTTRDFIIERWLSPECLINYNQGTYECNISSGYDYITPLSGWNVFNFADRYYHTGGKRLKKTTTKYWNNSTPLDELITIKEYYYENAQRPNVPTKFTTTNSKSEIITTNLKYPYDFSTAAPFSDMISRNIIAPVVEQTQTNTTLNKEIGKLKVNYSYWQGNTLILPSAIQKSILGNPLETETTINEYDPSGNILQVTGKDGVVTAYVWGYGQTYPVAKVIGKSYQDAVNQSGINLSIVSNILTTESDLRNELNKLRTLTNSFVTTYTYKPLVGMTSETDPRGRTTYYEYDVFNRLILVKDNLGKILKKICYNYAGQQEDCSYACPPNSPAVWQNTGNIRCQKDIYGQNTGYQEIEQTNTNPCNSATTQWIPGSQNTSACPLPVYVNLTSTNTYNTTGYVATYDNGLHQYTFNVSTASGLQALGTVPAGNYTLTITRPMGVVNTIFRSGCFKQVITGNSATFYNVAVSPTTCNSITVTLDAAY